MPGGRHLGDKLRQELAALVSDIRKDVQAHTITFEIQADLVYYPTRPSCQTQHISFEAPLIPVHQSDLNTETKPVHRLDLVPQASLKDIPCHFEQIALNEPIFSANNITCHPVSFENLGKAKIQYPTPKPFPIAKPRTQQQAVPKLATLPRSWSLQGLKTISRNQNTEKLRARHQVMPAKLWMLPIRRSPLPPHRFTTEQRDRFRTALAEKSGTSPNNVQIKVIFDRLTMSMFSAIDQDERGNLLCSPKAELLGKKAGLLPQQTTTYLIMGSRIDTGASIRALVPSEEPV